MSPKQKPPAPPKKVEFTREVQDGVATPELVRELIDACGMIAVFIPTSYGIRFFITTKFTPAQAEEFATILEDCANTVRGMNRDPGKVQ